MKLLVINGPNLNLLGMREPEIYGRKTYKDLTHMIARHARSLGIGVTCYQSNSEGDLVTPAKEVLSSAMR